MKFNNTEVFNFEGALRGMRNPMNSWDKSDSKDCRYIENLDCDSCILFENCDMVNFGRCGYIIGQNDLKLAQNLIKAGTEHCKFMRQIMLSVDITAPLYWWKEFDTYKVGVTANSTSTMHKLSTTPITLDCFETDDYDENLGNYFSIPDNAKERDFGYLAEDVGFIIELLEYLRQTYVETKDIRYWKELIRWLPESWLQTRTVTMNYENVRNMYMQRVKHPHKLTEWRNGFGKWVESLPYSKELIMFE